MIVNGNIPEGVYCALLYMKGSIPGFFERPVYGWPKITGWTHYVEVPIPG